MCCVEQQHLSDKNRLILCKIEAFYRHFKAFFALLTHTSITIISFKKRVKIKLSTMDNSQRRHFITKITPSATKVYDYSPKGHRIFI